MRGLVFLLRERTGYVVAAALIGVLGGAASARLVGLVNDELFRAAAAAPPSIALFLGLTGLAFLTGLLSEAMLVLLSEQLTHRLRINLCAQIMKLPIASVERLGRARLTAIFTHDVPAINLAVLRIPTVCVSCTIMIGCLVYLGLLSSLILAVIGIFLLVAVTSYVLPERYAVRYLTTYRRSWDLLIKDFDAMTQGAKELKLHRPSRPSFLAEMEQGSAQRVRETAVVYRMIYVLLNYWSRTLFFLFIALVIYAVPAHTSLDLKTVTGFAIVALYLVGPLERLVNSVPRFREAAVAFDKIREVDLDIDSSRRDASLLDPGTSLEDFNRPTVVREIALRSVTHTYLKESDGPEFVLGPIDLTIAAGELVLVTGGNGSGKTTLAKLIAGLYLPAGGQVLLDGKLVTAGNREHYRRCFSAVFGDFHLFERVAADSDAELDARATAYLRKLRLDHKVKIEAGRLSTLALSAGQRKRLALLTAYLDDRPIYLFDEWASDQDPEFKEIYYREILPELRDRGKVVIVITHDDRYFHIADRLVRLDDGQLTCVTGPQLSPVATCSDHPAR